MNTILPESKKLSTSMKRGLSFESLQIFETLYPQDEYSESELEIRLLNCLYAVKFAERSGRITEVEKLELKTKLKSKEFPFEDSIYLKLNESERIAVRNYSEYALQHEADSNDPASDAKIEISIDNSIVQDQPHCSKCSICADCDLDSQGIECSNDQAKHFICNDCITSYVKSRNSEPHASSFFKREGKITCPALLNGTTTMCNCTYPIGELCSHIIDPKVLELFIDGLQYYQKSILVANHTEQLFENLEELKRSSANSVRMLERRHKLLELQELANSIKMNSDAKQCPHCGWGPILLDNNCDSLQDHHLQVLGLGGTYDNSCRQCGVLTPHKSQLLSWDGKLPQSLTADLNDPDGEAIVISASPECTSLSYRLAEIIKTLQINFADLSDTKFRLNLQNAMLRENEFGPDFLTRTRSALTESRDKRNQLHPPANDVRMINGTWNGSFLVEDATLRRGISISRPFSQPCAHFNKTSGCRNGLRCLFIHALPGTDAKLEA